MVTETRAEILFTRMGEPSISLQSTATGNREKFQEILLFCQFAADHVEKIEKHSGSVPAVFFTAFLFGIAHMSYGKIFPVLMPMVMGVILGFIILKTKNLYSSIIAHVAFNVTSLTLAYLGWELLENFALIL